MVLKSQNICPVCSNDSLELGEMIDVGVGYVKAGPDTCPICGYIEAGPDPHDLPIEHYRNCWKLGLDPHLKLPELRCRPLKPIYQEWIARNVPGDGYGRCEEFSRKMVAAFPGLRQAYGNYYCFVWGERGHFWCVDLEKYIVDRTSQQFPSRGRGLYSLKYFCSEKDPNERIDELAGL